MRRKALVAAGVFALWALLAFAVGPALIRSAHAGESLPFFNRAIRSDSGLSVEAYLSFWRRLSLAAGAALLGVAGLLFATAPLHARVAGPLRRARGAMPESGLSAVMILAIVAGCAAGFAEAVIALLRQRFFHLPTGAVASAEVFWMAPLAAAGVFAIVGSGILMLDRATGAGGALMGALPFLLTALSVFSAARRVSIGLHPLAAALLALGFASQTHRWVVRRTDRAARVLGRTAALMVAGLCVVAAGIPVLRQASARHMRDGAPPPSPGSPNVLLIVWDAARAASLSAWGHDRETTPELEKLAAEGILFERAIAPSPWTLPSHASMFTGFYPHQLSTGWNRPLDDARPTLAEALAARGYATGGFVANRFYAGRGFGLGRGFETYDDRVDINVMTALSTWWLSSRTILRGLELFRGDRGSTRRWAGDIDDSFLRWSRAVGDRPWFAFLNVFDAHEPYVAPSPFDRLFSDRPIRQALDPGRIVYQPAELEELRTSYEACLRYLDAELGRLLETLRLDGTLDRTVVIVTSDHGEEFGEHGNDLTRHGRSLYLPALHVPLVIRYPGLDRGVRVPDVVSLRDLPATVMDVLDLEAESPFPGMSLLGRSGTRTDPVLAMVQRHIQANLWPDWPASAGDMYSAILGDAHYIRDARGSESLFDIAADYWETKNLINDPAQSGTLARLRAAVDGLLRQSPSAR